MREALDRILAHTLVHSKHIIREENGCCVYSYYTKVIKNLIPSMCYCFTLSVSGTGFGSTAILRRIKRLLEMYTQYELIMYGYEIG